MRRSVSRMNLNLNEAAYQRIRDYILDGTFSLGTPLSRRRLSDLLHMSLVPVAQALQRLELEGLVESLPRVGTRVKIPRPEEVRGHYVIREALEAQVARMFVRTATRAHKKLAQSEALQLDRDFDAYFAAAEEQRSHAVHRSHVQFHHELAEVSGCNALVHQLEKSQVLQLNFRYTLVTPNALPRDWHKQLVDVLCSGSEEDADRVMRKHVSYRMEEVIATYERLLASGDKQNVSYRGPQRRRLASDVAQNLAGS